MLLELTIGNFLSFEKAKTLSLIPTTIKDHSENIIHDGIYKSLSSIAIYGANSSGKSNLLKGIAIMIAIVLGEYKKNSNSKIPTIPFLFKKTNRLLPTKFEIIFILDSIKYRYGFEVNNIKVLSEWFFKTEKKTETPLFIRTEDGISVLEGFEEGLGLESKTLDNTLFLNLVDQNNGTISKKIISWFHHFNVISGLDHENYQNITFDMLNDVNTNNILLDFYKKNDLGFDAISIIEEDVKPNPLSNKRDMGNGVTVEFTGAIFKNIKTAHKIFDENNEENGNVNFLARDFESSGTNKLIDISGPIFDSLLNGSIIVIDELDAKLHPLLTISIIELFKNKEINKKNAQLIFATHDTNILSRCKLRRDQIYFTEKDNFGATDLYSLVEYKLDGNKKVRNDNSFEKDYLNGRYGAIPYIGNFKELLKK